jgi:hypothetical protein
MWLLSYFSINGVLLFKGLSLTKSVNREVCKVLRSLLVQRNLLTYSRNRQNQINHMVQYVPLQLMCFSHMVY